MAAAATHSASARRSRASRIPPEACHSMRGKRRTASGTDRDWAPSARRRGRRRCTARAAEPSARETRHRVPQRERATARASRGWRRTVCRRRRGARRRPARSRSRPKSWSQCAHLVRLGQSGAADDDAVDARGRAFARPPRVSRKPPPTCRLTRVLRGELGDDRRGCRRCRRARRRDRRRAASRRRALRYLREQSARVGRVARFGGEVAAQQPHAAAALQIDGGDQAHVGAAFRGPESSAAGARRRPPSARDEIAPRKNCATARRR